MNKCGHGMSISLLTIVLGFLMLPFLPGLVVVGYPIEMAFGEITETSSCVIFSIEIILTLVASVYYWYRGHHVAGPIAFFYSLVTGIVFVLVQLGY
jgi:hypothetical protein